MSLPVIVSAVRTAVGKAPRGKLSATRPDDMAAAAPPLPTTTIEPGELLRWTLPMAPFDRWRHPILSLPCCSEIVRCIQDAGVTEIKMSPDWSG